MRAPCLILASAFGGAGVEVYHIGRHACLEGRHARVVLRPFQLFIDERLHLRVIHRPTRLERLEAVDHFLRRHRVDERYQHRRCQLLERTNGYGVWNLVRHDHLRLIDRRGRLGQQLHLEGEAVCGWIVLEQNGIGPDRRLDVQPGVEPLHGLTPAQRSPVEENRVGLAAAQVLPHGGA